MSSLVQFQVVSACSHLAVVAGRNRYFPFDTQHPQENQNPLEGYQLSHTKYAVQAFRLVRAGSPDAGGKPHMPPLHPLQPLVDPAETVVDADGHIVGRPPARAAV